MFKKRKHRRTAVKHKTSRLSSGGLKIKSLLQNVAINYASVARACRIIHVRLARRRCLHLESRDKNIAPSKPFILLFNETFFSEARSWRDKSWTKTVTVRQSCLLYCQQITWEGYTPSPAINLQHTIVDAFAHFIKRRFSVFSEARNQTASF